MYLKDIRVTDDDGNLIYEGPPFQRCTTYGCRKLVTAGYAEKYGSCECGGRKTEVALALLPEEIEGLREGLYLLTEWEEAFVKEELCQN